MKRIAIAASTLAAATASAHPGHGAMGWFHKHEDDLVDAAMIVGACVLAAVAVRLVWKLAKRPQ